MMPDVLICEMAPRDGLQFLGARPGEEPRNLVPLDLKLELLFRLQKSGLKFIEATAFVSDRVAQMRDADQLCAQLRRTGETQLAALVPNLKHYQRFKNSGLDTVSLFVSASEKYSMKNTGMTIAEAMARAAEVAEAARQDKKRLRAHLSGAFQELFADHAPSDINLVIDLTRRLIEMGCEHVALADTDGTTDPKRVTEVVNAVSKALDLKQIALHLHDRYGQGLSNAYAAVQCGARIFDSAVGGIGGTITAQSDDSRGVAGNIATEELVWLLHRLGYQTGVDLDRLLDAGKIVHTMTLGSGSSPPSRLLRDRLGYGLTWHDLNLDFMINPVEEIMKEKKG